MELLYVVQEEFDYFLHTYYNIGWDQMSYFEYCLLWSSPYQILQTLVVL